jgi:dTDP-glucose 4,6-dehydratase
MKKILITGGTGFIGSYLVREFINDHQVVCLVRPGTKNLDRLKGLDIQYIEHDIKNSCISLLDQLKDVEMILHAGANPSSASSIENPLECVQDNVVGTLNLLELSRRLNLKRFVYYSSAEIFGPIPIGHDSRENDAYNSNSPYAASKAGGEELCLAYSNTFKIPVSVIHLNNTFGPRCQSARLPVIIIKKLLNDEVLDIHAGANGEVGGRRWMFAGDVASHTRFLLSNQENKCEKWNSAGLSFIDNLSFAKMIAKAMNKELKYNLVSVDRPGHDLCFSVDPSKFSNLGWVPERTTEERLAETVEWYLDNKEWLTRE